MITILGTLFGFRNQNLFLKSKAGNEKRLGFKMEQRSLFCFFGIVRLIKLFLFTIISEIENHN